MSIVLRPVVDADLAQLFAWEQHPQAIEMAAFTRADPSDRAAFDAHYQHVRADLTVLIRAIDDGGAFVGTVASFAIDGDREVTYWIDPAQWGRGIASAALSVFLDLETTRPLWARVADHNVGSAKVLGRSGFVRVRSETSWAAGLRRDIVEGVYRLG